MVPIVICNFDAKTNLFSTISSNISEFFGRQSPFWVAELKYLSFHRTVLGIKTDDMWKGSNSDSLLSIITVILETVILKSKATNDRNTYYLALIFHCETEEK